MFYYCRDRCVPRFSSVFESPTPACLLHAQHLVALVFMHASENDPNAIPTVCLTEWIWALKPRFPVILCSFEAIHQVVFAGNVETLKRMVDSGANPGCWLCIFSSWTRFVSVLYMYILIIIVNYDELNTNGERYPERCGEISTKACRSFSMLFIKNLSVPSLVFSRWDPLGIFARDRKPQTCSSIYMMFEMQGMFDDACASLLPSAAVRMCAKISIWRSSHQRQGRWHCSWCFVTFDLKNSHSLLLDPRAWKRQKW